MDPQKPVTPENFDELERSSPAGKAGGLPSIYHSMRHVWEQSGPLKGGRALARLNQKGGFDCPSCAWPDPDGERAATEFCENGAKAIASEATRRRITREFFAQHSVQDLSEQSDHWHEQQGRLTEPFVLRDGARHYEPLAWEEAFDMVGASLKELESPDQAIFYTSGRASNEAAFLYQLFVRMFGTNNLPDCSNMCHESSGVALKEAIGVGKGTVSLEDIHNAELLIIIGQNPGTNHPRMLSSLQKAKENGARIVSINPLKETGLVAFAHPQKVGQLLGGKTYLTDEYIRIKTNGDQALLKGVAKRVLENAAEDPSALDRAFIDGFTEGLDDYVQGIDSEDWDGLIELSGASRSEMEALGDAICRSERIITCWAMGLTQHRNAVATIQEVVNLHLLRGALGKPGAGLCPVRGHSNVQGDRTMGIFEAMPDSFLDRLEKRFGFEAPRKHGYNTVDAIQAMLGGKGKVFFALGGNFLSASPDTEYTARALERCELTVHVSTKLNRSHLVTGKQALILPCLGRSERDMQATGPQSVSVENSMGVVSLSQGRLSPASNSLKSEVAIICGLAEATLPAMDKFDWTAFADDYAKIRDAIESVIPGFENFNQRVANSSGFYLRNPVKERLFETSSGKANFSRNALDIEEPESGKLLLMTIRSHDQFNTTIYGMNDRYRGISGERRIVFVNPDDMKQRNLTAEQVISVRSHFGGETRMVGNIKVIPYDIPKSCAAMYFPEANPLVPIGHQARRSATPASKSIQVTLEPSCLHGLSV